MNKKQLKYYNKGFRDAFVVATIVYAVFVFYLLNDFSNKLEELIKLIS